jgi:transcription elongation factor Elf1
MTVKLLAAVDRRRPNRVSPPVCPRCGTDDAVTVMNRSSAFVNFHCESCRDLLPMPVPVVAVAKKTYVAS